MKVLKAESDDESLKIYIGERRTEKGGYKEFSYRYSVFKDGVAKTVVSTKEYFKSEMMGFRLTMQDVLALLSRNRSRLNLGEIESYYTELLKRRIFNGEEKRVGKT